MAGFLLASSPGVYDVIAASRRYFLLVGLATVAVAGANWPVVPPFAYHSLHNLHVWLLNASLDAAAGLELALATTSNQAVLFDMHGKKLVVRSSRSDGPYRRFVLPELEPWTMRLLVVDKP